MAKVKNFNFVRNTLESKLDALYTADQSRSREAEAPIPSKIKKKMDAVNKASAKLDELVTDLDRELEGTGLYCGARERVPYSVPNHVEYYRGGSRWDSVKFS